MVSFAFDGTTGRWTTFVKAFDEDDQVGVYGVVPFAIDQTKRMRAAELITRINYGLVFGNFEMDFTDGEIACVKRRARHLHVELVDEPARLECHTRSIRVRYGDALEVSVHERHQHVACVRVPPRACDRAGQ